MYIAQVKDKIVLRSRIVAELRQKYPRRWALMDELGRV